MGKVMQLEFNPGNLPAAATPVPRGRWRLARVLTWEYSILNTLPVEFPQIKTNINQILSDRLQELGERFREAATEKVAKRSALTLLRLVKNVGKQHQAGVQVSLSREELAQMTGTTLFTIGRILSRWSDEDSSFHGEKPRWCVTHHPWN